MNAEQARRAARSLNPAIAYERRGEELAREGLYPDVLPWQHHVSYLREQP